ncbi:hypothetical protein [Sphingobium sp.]|uniref:hypothetical protein n=1 Tax=Sphingobium sp. TaxID=1912891 RepID=UPI0025E93E2C|nr:hypothetical protein [Sphingobium sp.]
MTYVSLPLASGSVAVLSIIVNAARRWREARDMGVAIQPHLFVSLAQEGCGILAPVIDSLMHFYEIALRRPMRTACGEVLSHDEDLLIELLSGTKQRRACLGDSGDMGDAFDTALMSTRIMVRMAFSLPAIG